MTTLLSSRPIRRPISASGPDQRRPAITGIGLATPLGSDASATWSALLAGKFITDHSHIPVGDPADPDRLRHLFQSTAREAIAQAGWTAEQLADDSTGLIAATSKGPAAQWITPPLHMSCLPYVKVGEGWQGGRGGPIGWGISQPASALAADLGLGAGPRLVFSAACAGGLHALIRAAMLIQAGQASRVLVVAAESSIHPLFVGSFQRLGVLPRPGIGCRPFDQDREGFLISEAAAAICLESSDGETSSTLFSGRACAAFPADGIQRPASGAAKRAFAQIEHFALGGDATHLTGGDPQAATLRYLLGRVIAGRPVDLVHAHGTGTVVNDPAELAAIEASLSGGDGPAIYSHKGALGHSLGAAGLVSVVLNCLAHRAELIPPNVQTYRPLPTRLKISRQPIHRPIRRSLVLSAGFGGTIAVASLISEREPTDAG